LKEIKILLSFRSKQEKYRWSSEMKKLTVFIQKKDFSNSTTSSYNVKSNWMYLHWTYCLVDRLNIKA